MRDQRRGALLAGMLFLIFALIAYYPSSEVEALSEDGYLEWSYSETKADGSLSREGIQTATVTTGIRNEEDVFILQGTISGTYWTPDSSGTENGQWEGVYRQIDLSLVYMWKDIDVYIESQSLTTTNESDLRYDAPYFRWMKFPIDVGDTWRHDIDSTRTWRIYYGGDEISSGSDLRSENYRWGCSRTENVTVQAGTYHDCYVIKQWEMIDDFNYETSGSYWYSETVGWWVKYVEKEYYQEEEVVTKEWELISTSGNNPPIAGSVEEVIMDEDTTDSSIDVSTIFSDPEGDPLSYDAVDTGELDVRFTGSIVRITPPENAHGTFYFNLTAKDPSNDPVKALVRVIVNPVDDSTTMYDGSVSPESGEPGSTFKYSIYLKDLDGDDPGTVSVFIDGSSSRMTKVSGSMVSGALYEFSTDLDLGEHEYHFVAGSLRFPSTGEIQGPEITSTREPVLSEPELDLEEGGTDTLFTFDVIWTDILGREPDEVYVVLDEMDYYEMVSDNDDPVEGMRYSVSTFLGEGNHMHHFEAVLDQLTVSYPSGGELIGPDVFDPEISDSGIKGEIEEGENVEFFITIIYGLGETPDEVTITLDGIDYSLFAGGGDILTGMNLTRSFQLEPGSYTYSFYVMIDGKELTTGQRSINIQGSAVDDDDSVPVNSRGGLDPMVIVLIVVVILILGVLVYIFYLRRGPPDKNDEESWEDEDVSWDDERSGNIRGL